MAGLAMPVTGAALPIRRAAPFSCIAEHAIAVARCSRNDCAFHFSAIAVDTHLLVLDDDFVDQQPEIGLAQCGVISARIEAQAAAASAAEFLRRSTKAFPASRTWVMSSSQARAPWPSSIASSIAQCSVSERGCHSSSFQVANRKRASLRWRSWMTAISLGMLQGEVIAR